MLSSIESLLAAVQGKELQNRRASLAILIFAVIASLVTIGILHRWYPWWCAFSALVLLGAFALYLIRAGVRRWAVSPEEVAILVDAALPTKERCSALLSLRSSLDPIDTARSLFISQQLSEILAEGPHPAQIAPFKLSGSERCALITALLLTLSAILLFVFRPQPKLLALAAKIESILAADPTIPKPLRAQALALAEAIKDTPLGSSQINIELNGARKELEQALAESERGKSLGERTVQGSKEAREYPREPKQKQATPIPVPPTPGPHEQKKQEPQEEKQQGKEQQKQGAQEQKEKEQGEKEQKNKEQGEKEQGKEEQSAKEQSGSGQGSEKEESGDNSSQQGSEKQEQAGEEKQQGGSKQGDSADKDPSAKEQGGQQGDGDGQGSGKGAGEGEGKGNGGEGKGVGSGDGKGQGSGESSDSDSSSANSGSAEASSGTTGKQDQGKQGSAGQEGAQGGSSASGSQSSSLQQLEAALNEVEQGVKQQGQGQEGTGAEKGPQPQPQPQSQSQPGSQAGAQGADSKGAGKGAAKEPSKSDPENSENSNSDSKQAKEGSDSGSSDKAKQKPSEKTENEEQGEQDSNGERSALPDRDAPAQTGGLSDGAGSAGLGSNQGFKEAPIGSLKEVIDERFTDESSNLEKNLEPAQAKTTIEDLPLTKPKGSLQRGEQPIPLEYSDILKGPSPS